MHPNRLRGQEYRAAIWEARKEFGDIKPTRAQLAAAAAEKCGSPRHILVEYIHTRLAKVERDGLDLKKYPVYAPRSDQDVFEALRVFLSQNKRSYTLRELWTLAPQYAKVPVRRMREYLLDMGDEDRKKLGLNPHHASYKAMYELLVATRITHGIEKPTMKDLCERAAATSKYKYTAAALESYIDKSIREKHKKDLDLRPYGKPYSYYFEAAQKARKTFKKRPTLLQVAEVAGRLCGISVDSFYTNFLCKAIEPSDEIKLDMKRQKSCDKKKLMFMYEARKNFTANKPNRIQLAKNAARTGNMSESAMIDFAKKRLKDDDIRSLDLRGEGELSTRKKSIPGPVVHDVFAKRVARTSRQVLMSRLYNRCFIAVYTIQLRPAKEHTIENVALSAKMSPKEVEDIFQKYPELLRILRGYKAAQVSLHSEAA